MNKNILWQGEILKFIQSVVDLVQEKEKKKAKNQNVSTTGCCQSESIL